MPCTTLTVQAQVQPTVTISSITFAKKNLLGGWDPVNSTCQEPSTLAGKDLGMIVTGNVAGAPANFQFEVSYVSPQVLSKVLYFDITGQAVGNFSIVLIPNAEKYETGLYQALSARALNVSG